MVAGTQTTRPERAEAPSPGRCPGLGASALSGRVGQNLRSSAKITFNNLFLNQMQDFCSFLIFLSESETIKERNIIYEKN